MYMSGYLCIDAYFGYLDYVYFADTHGDMDLEKVYKKFVKPLSIL